MHKNYFNINISICKEKHPHLNISEKQPTFNDRIAAGESREGLPIFKYKINNDDKKFFHSTYDPVAEAKLWIDKLRVKNDEIIVIMGVGYFYHVFALLTKVPVDQTIILIEKEEEIFFHALKSINLVEILNRDNLWLFVGDKTDEAIEFISRVQLNNNFRRISFSPHPISVQTFPEFYHTIINAFNTANKISIYNRLRYKKFIGDDAKVLLLTTQYFLMGEVISALKRLDIDYRLITIVQNELGCEDFIKEIIRNILEFKPDFLLTINHLGLDREGVLAQFFEKIEMPFASWYVDNPNLIIKQYNNNVSSYCTLFLWDKDNLPDMKRFGFEHCFYLPLGVDEKRFCPIGDSQNPLSHLSSKIAFVGNSMAQKVRKSLKKTNANGCLRSLFHSIAIKYMESSERDVEKIIKLLYPELYEDFMSLTDTDISNYETAVSWEATRVYRLERVIKLLPFNPLIVGDTYWSEIIDNKGSKYNQELSYYDELPYLYNIVDINFNATSRQMKGAVNQRVFDVPACKQFLLTDFQMQLSELFEIGKEVMCYNDPDEIPGLVSYYLAHESERKRIAENGYNRVLRDHTYVSRVKEMVSIMRELYK